MTSDLDAIVLSLAAWRGSHLRRAWRPIIASDRYSWQTVRAQFGGVPLLKADEAWPQCSECDVPMKLMLQFDVSHLPRGLYPLPAGLLQYFQCDEWSSCSTAIEAYRAFSKGKIVRIIEGDDLRTPPVPPGMTPFPLRSVARWAEFWDLPSPEEHGRLGLEYAYDFQPGYTRSTVAWRDGGTPRSGWFGQRNDDPTPGLAESIGQAAEGDKLGGWPLWVQSVDYPLCSACGAEMRYVLQLDWYDNLPFDFGDCGTGHLTYCPSHPENLTFAFQCS
jgi:hypothetical protein